MKPDPALKRVLDMLYHNAHLTYAVVVSDPDTDPVVVTIAKRSKPIVTIDIEIQKDKFDPFKFLELVEQHQPPQSPKEQPSDPYSF
jgi:hypothetical protein